MSSENEGHRRYTLRARAEAERRTRERIVRATMELHKDVGPANTTVAEIARRANVTRLTVYNHFPDEAALFGACQAQWMGLHPLPDFSAVLKLRDPVERVRGVLRGFYGWYAETAQMVENVQRDRNALPALDGLMERTADARLAQLAMDLSDGFRARDQRSVGTRTMIRLALDFWTWRRLQREGLDDRAAADLMTDAIATIARPVSTRRRKHAAPSRRA
jgi:AcrR family transcriptional regulator